MAFSKKQHLKNMIAQNLIHLKLNKCIKCNGRVRFTSKSSFQTICTRPLCKTRRSVFSESIFKKFNKGVEGIIRVFELLFESIRLRSIAKLMPYDYRNLKIFVSKVNQYVKNNYFKYLDVIGGPGIIVEIDESKFGKRKYNRGHRVDGVWVLGMIERTPEKLIVLIPVENRNNETLITIIRRHVAPGSVIYSDQWRGYNSLFEYYTHKTVNHSKHFVDPLTGIHTNFIEGNWAPIKQNIYKKWRTKKIFGYHWLLKWLK
ncbi:hypothetical protein EHP00_1629 [Ecytonucleospora hepatopenaei]|uniref:ISXO2-like transposase domain-containing protein n=1 Tax=Ecytonucleospora hepatopenaei TaxID=646526 RepID=A0A1W0E4B7_9MICR|nr:hypothetical protein EHP00_1629 [Ecytonucleospora hepatopenaei]